MNKKELIISTIKNLTKLQYMYEQESLEVGGKVIKTEKDLARIYKQFIEKELERNEDREDNIK